MERRFFPGARVALQKRADGKEVIVGHGAVYYDGTPATEYKLWENFVERVMPGTFDRAIRERDDARSLFNHSPSALLGRVSSGTLSLASDAKGLAYEVDPGDTQVARDVKEFIRRGDLTGSSFGFIVTDQEFLTVDGIDIRMIKGVELFDVGPVTYPAYEGTDTGLRSAEDAAGAREALAAHRAAARRGSRAKAARAKIVEIEQESCGKPQELA